ncbi:MAG: FG-GAP-like repeat-containing protein, partial [Solirubrobacteraceae bacterium]
SISASDETGTTRNFSSYLDNGTSYMLLDLSARWCGPSVQEQPALKTAMSNLATRGIHIHLVEMLLDGNTPGVASITSDAHFWSQKYGVSPVFSTSGDTTGPQYTAGRRLLGLPPAFPTSLLIAPNGKILDLVQGARDAGAIESEVLHFVAPQVNFYKPLSLGGGSDTETVTAGNIIESIALDKPALVLANASDNNVSVLERNGANDGYDAPQNFSVDSGPFAVAIGDVNNDQAPDLVTANYGWMDGTHQNPGWNNTVSVLTGIGDGTFNAAQNITVGAGPSAVAVGDVNGDGFPDIVVANSGPVDQQTELFTGNTITVLLQKSTHDGFLPGQTYTVGNGPLSVGIGDLDGDGWPDVVVGNFTGTVSVLYGDGLGGLETQQALSVGTSAFSVALADVNGDGKPDIVAADPGGGDVAVLQRDLGNTGFDTAQTYPTDGNPYVVAVGDLNGDGRPDIVTADSYHNNTDQPGTTVTEILRNKSNTGFGSPTHYTVGAGPSSLALADLNGDGKLDIVSSSPGTPSGIDTLFGAFDGAAPVAKDNVPSVWVKAPRTVTLTATDTGGPIGGAASGVATIKYLVGVHPGDPRNSANHPLTYNPAHKPVLQNGQRIAYSAVDNIGNVEPTRLSRVLHVITNAQIRTALRSEIAPSGAPAKIPAILSHGGYSFTHFKLPAPGTAALTWSHAQNGNLIVVARGKLTRATNGTGKLTVALTPAGRAMLRHAKQLSVLGEATLKTAGRPPVSTSRSFTLTS